MMTQPKKKKTIGKSRISSPCYLTFPQRMKALAEGMTDNMAPILGFLDMIENKVIPSLRGHTKYSTLESAKEKKDTDKWLKSMRIACEKLKERVEELSKLAFAEERAIETGGRIERHDGVDADLKGLAVCCDGMEMVSDEMKNSTLKYLEHRYKVEETSE